MTYREACENLANAIVIQAAQDYRKALKGKGVGGCAAENVIKSIKIFFISEWFKALTQVDGKLILKKLNDEAERGERCAKKTECAL